MIVPLEPPYSEAVTEDLTKLMPPGMAPLALFRAVAHNPRVLRRLRKGGLLDPGAISLRDRELVILRTTARCGAEYEWGVHVAFFARAAGLTDDEVAATIADDGSWTGRDATLVAICDALHDHARLPAGLGAELSEAELVEVLALVGQYHMVSFLVNAAALSPEPGAARFPVP